MHFTSGTGATATAVAAAVSAATAAVTTTATTGATLGLAGRAAFGATIRLVLEAFTREELLFSRAKNELTVAINAVQVFICVQLYWGLSMASGWFFEPR